MGKNKSARFLIDRIDARLGDKRKEIKFDVIMIIVGLLLILIPGIAIILTSELYPKLSILFTLLVMFGIVLVYTMTKEYISDKKDLRP